ncbi:hypothetical protein Tco_0546972 [Tanacetum coccineum]
MDYSLMVSFSLLLKEYKAEAIRLMNILQSRVTLMEESFLPLLESGCSVTYGSTLRSRFTNKQPISVSTATSFFHRHAQHQHDTYLEKIEGTNYKTVGPDVSEHLCALEIERRQFMQWIEDFQLPVGLKLYVDVHVHGGVGDPDSHIWKFKCATKENAWNNPMPYLKDKFVKDFQPRMQYTGDYVNLQFIEQTQDRHLVNFTKRFNNEEIKIPGVNGDQKISAFIGNMIKGAFLQQTGS